MVHRSSVLIAMLLFVGHSLFAREPEGRILAIGINRVSTAHYGSELRLNGCHNDAKDMWRYAKVNNFNMDKSQILLDEEATVEKVEEIVKGSAAELKKGDLFVLSIAAHGGQMQDINGDEEEANAGDRADETWYLYNRQYLDDELFELLGMFKSGVRVLVIADTCHAGTFVRSPDEKDRNRSIESRYQFIEAMSAARQLDRAFRSRSTEDENKFLDTLGKEKAGVVRVVPQTAQPYTGFRTVHWETQLDIYLNNRKTYEDIADTHKNSRNEENGGAGLCTRVIALGACEDNEKAGDGLTNGAFTTAFKKVYEGYLETPPTRNENYRNFLIETRAFVPHIQTPSYQALGPKISDIDFDNQKPFQVKN